MRDHFGAIEGFVAELFFIVKVVLQSLIEYPVTGGVYRIDYGKGAPVLTFDAV